MRKKNCENERKKWVEDAGERKGVGGGWVDELGKKGAGNGVGTWWGERVR